MAAQRTFIMSLCIAGILLVSGIFCALFAYQEKCMLKAELAEAQQKTTQSTAPRANVPSLAQMTDSIPQSPELQRENAKLLAELVSEEEVNRLLDHAQQCYDTYKALKQTNLGLGMCAVQIFGPKDIERYWSTFEADKKKAENDYQALANLIAKLDLSQLTQDEKDDLDKFMELHKKWSQIIYDMDVSPEEKSNFGREIWEIHNNSQIDDHLSQLADEALGDRFKQYKEREFQFQHLAINPASTSVIIKGRHNFTYADRPYYIIVPDDFTFPDDTTLDDE